MDEKEILYVSFGNWEGKKYPEEDVALGKYDAVVQAVQQYAHNNNFSFDDREGKNVYMEMCDRRIGAFAHGWEHVLTLTKDDQEMAVKARIEAHYFRDLSTHGEVTITFSGNKKDLVALVNEAWETNQPISAEKREEYMKRFTTDKSRCYGLCKE